MRERTRGLPIRNPTLYHCVTEDFGKNGGNLVVYILILKHGIICEGKTAAQWFEDTKKTARNRCICLFKGQLVLNVLLVPSN